MKAFYCFTILLAAMTGSLFAEVVSSIPLDFTPGLVKGSSDDTALARRIAARYNNKVGIAVNPNVEEREDVVRPAKQNVNGPIAALFKGKKGSDLAKIAASAAKKNPAQVNLIAAAAIRQNIANGGGPEIDMEIGRAIIAALGTQLEPEAAAVLIGLATDRLPSDYSGSGIVYDFKQVRPPGDDSPISSLDQGVRDLRAQYLLNYPSADIPSVALALDSNLVNRRIASALNLGDNLYSSLQSPNIDTNPFFSGDQGIGNFGTQGGGGGGGGGGGTPNDPVNPNPPAS